MSEYIKEVTLPTRGRIYPEESGVPEIVKIRGITTKEEKIIFGSTDNAIQDVIQECILEPKNLKVSNLIAADSMTILMDLRMISYGTEYKVPFTCQECGKKNPNITVDLSELDFNELPDDFEEPFEITLPRSGDVLGVFFLRNSDFRDVDRWERRLRKQSPNIKGDIGYVLRMAKQIRYVNGEEIEKDKARFYVEEMQGIDSAYFWDQMNKFDIGYDLRIDKICVFCGADNEFDLPVTAEFFRPSF